MNLKKKADSMLPDISNQQLASSKNDEEIVRQTSLQIIKDFAQFGMDIEFPDNIHIAYDTLFKQVNQYISDLITTDYSKLQNLLYRIDLSNSNLKLALSASSDSTKSVIITELILDRELRKVLLRIFFSGSAT